MNDPKFLLTLQPRMYECNSSDEAEQDDSLDGDVDQKLSMMGGAESMLLLDQSQVPLVAAGS